MYKTLDGSETFSGAFGSLLAMTIIPMLRYVKNPYLCNTKVEFGVPFFDDLDAIGKARLLYETQNALFNSNSEPPADNAYAAATIHAVCRYIVKKLNTEIKTRNHTKKKYGKELCHVRALVLAAFRERYPKHPFSPPIDSADLDLFTKMAERLSAEILPYPYFLMTELEPEKRNELAKRMDVPDDYFSDSVAKVPECCDDPDSYLDAILDDTLNLCLSVCTNWLDRDHGLYAEIVRESLVQKQTSEDLLHD